LQQEQALRSTAPRPLLNPLLPPVSAKFLAASIAKKPGVPKGFDVPEDVSREPLSGGRIAGHNASRFTAAFQRDARGAGKADARCRTQEKHDRSSLR
jgi:hypothetical protein